MSLRFTAQGRGLPIPPCRRNPFLHMRYTLFFCKRLPQRNKRISHHRSSEQNGNLSHFGKWHITSKARYLRLFRDIRVGSRRPRVQSHAIIVVIGILTLYRTHVLGTRTNNCKSRKQSFSEGILWVSQTPCTRLRARCGLETTINPHTSQSVGTSHALAPHLGHKYPPRLMSP